MREGSGEAFHLFRCPSREIEELGGREHEVSEWCPLIAEVRVDFRMDRPDAR